MSDLRMRIVKKRSSHGNCDVDQSQNDSLPRNLLARQGSPVGSSEAVVSMEPEARSKRRKSGEQQEMAALRQQLSEATGTIVKLKGEKRRCLDRIGRLEAMVIQRKQVSEWNIPLQSLHRFSSTLNEAIFKY